MKILNLHFGAGILLLALALVFSACSEQFSGSGEEGPVNIVAAKHRTANFSAINQHLDLGGTVYGYMDIEGDIAQLTDKASAYLDKMRAIEPGQIPEHIDFKTIIERLGLHHIQGIGISSYQLGDLYRNKTFVYAPGQPAGLMKVFIGENKPFDSVAKAPAGADLLFEQSFDVTALRDLIFAIANDVMGDMGTQMLSAQLQQPLGGLPTITPAKLIDSLNTRLVMVADIDTTTELTVQAAGTPLSLNAVDFYLSLENLGWLVDDLAGMFAGMPQLTFNDTANAHTVTSNVPFPEPWNYYSPVIKHDKANKQLIIASSTAFLERCLSADSAIRKDGAFKVATRDLPMQGNHFQYVSPSIGKVGQELLNTFLTQQDNAEMKTALSTYQDLLPNAKHGTASAAELLPEGLLVISNSETSHKSNTSMLAANPVTIGLLAAIAIPAFNKVREQSKNKAMVSNIREHEYEAQEYWLEEGGSAAPHAQLEDNIAMQPSLEQQVINARRKMVDRIELSGTSHKGAIINGKFTKIGRNFDLGGEKFKLVKVKNSVIIVQDQKGQLYYKKF